MKRLFGLIIVLMVTSAVFAELNEKQNQLRSDIMNFLSEEGFRPELDDDGEIAFKREGVVWYIRVSDVDSVPMYVSLALYYTYNDLYTRQFVSESLGQLNDFKAVKTSLYGKSYSYRAEMYLNEANTFNDVFYKLVDQILSMKKELNEMAYKKQNQNDNQPQE